MSINLNDLPALVEKLQKLDRSLDLEALKTSIAAVEQAMADMAESLGPALTKGIADAIVKGLEGANIGGDAKAPEVRVEPRIEVAAPIIKMPEIKMPAMPEHKSPKTIYLEPELNSITGRPKRWKITVE